MGICIHELLIAKRGKLKRVSSGWEQGGVGCRLCLSKYLICTSSVLISPVCCCFSCLVFLGGVMVVSSKIGKNNLQPDYRRQNRV